MLHQPRVTDLFLQSSMEHVLVIEVGFLSMSVGVVRAALVLVLGPRLVIKRVRFLEIPVVPDSEGHQKESPNNGEGEDK
jgi:hypothetical protein